MKIYVAARLHAKPQVNDLHARLYNLGYSVTHDWTTHKNIVPYAENLDLAQAYAKADIAGVMAADVFVLLTDPEVGAGSAGELGAAIALQQVQGKPDIYVVGPDIAKNLFYYHPAVKCLGSTEQLLQVLAARLSTLA